MKRYLLASFLLVIFLKSYSQSCTLNVAITSSAPAICSDDVVTLTATASAGTPAYHYVWNTGETTTSIHINKGGTYSVTVTDNTPGCQPVVQQITISQANTPNAPTAFDAITCPNTPVTVTALAPGGFYQWYDAAVGGNLVGTGPTFTTPPLQGLTVYYVQTTIASCTSLRHPVKVYVVSNLSVSNANVCGNSPATFTAHGAISYKWYDAPGGNVIGTDSMFTTPVLTQSTTYYVQGTANGCTSNVTPVTAFVMPATPAPVVANPNITVCAGTSASLSATPLNGVVFQWFDVPSGGTAFINSPDYTTPHLLASKTYYVQATANNCPSPRTAVTVTVNPIPLAPAATGAEICQGAQATLAVSSPDGSTYQWFDSANGQNVLATGNSFQTPALMNSTIYYVQSSNGGCVSPRTAVTATVDPSLTAPSASGQTICPGSIAALTATTPKGTLQWYDAPVGGNLLAAGGNYVSAPLTTDTNYYVQATNNGCISPRTKVHVAVLPIPVAPTATGQTICNGTSATLIAAGAFTNYEWYDAPTGGNLLTTSQAYITPALNATTTYYLQTQVNGCVSARSPVTVTVDPALPQPTAPGITICQNTATSLTASVASGTIQWYDAPNGGNLLATGSTFNTPVLASTTTYYVQSTNGQCNSPRTAVTVTIKAVPSPGFLYSSGIYCLSGVNPSPVIGNPAGGTFSATPAGMVFTDPATGEINLAASDTGTYNVTFTSNGCVNVGVTKIILVITPDAQFSFNGPYCQDGGDALPTFPKGAGGGMFTALPAGLVFNSPITGDINLGASKPGTYTVTNTIPASGTCPETTYSSTVTIDQTAIVSAGPNQTVPTGSTVQLAGKFKGASAITWSGGLGSFSNPADTNAVYTPKPGESSATLMLTTTDPPGVCGPKSSTVTITFGLPVAAPTAADVNTCPGNPATLIATAPGGAYQWYDAPVGGNLVDTSAVFNTPALNATTKYYVQTTMAGVTSVRTAVTVTVNNTTPPVASGITACSGSPATLSASGSAGTYAWYTAAVGGNLIATTSSYVTSPLINDTAFYVQSVVNGCISARTQVNVKVNKVPVITSAAAAETCSGTALNYVITSDSIATYSWSRVAVANISNPAVNNQVSGTIGETLINTSNQPANVTYIITPTGKCTGAPFNLVVSVNPVAMVTSAPSVTICNNTSPDYTVLFGVAPDSFTWSRAAVNGITNPPISDQIAPTLREVLTSFANTPIDVHYTFTANTKNCPASVFDFKVTVNPTAIITSGFLTDICSGSSPNYTITSNLSPVTFSWSREAIPGIANPAVYNQTSNVINETLVDTTFDGIFVPYTITPLYNGCPGTPFIYQVGVSANLRPPAAKSNSPVCLNSTIRLSTDDLPGGTYFWTGPNGFTSTDQNPVISNVTKANAGKYTLVVTLNCPSVPSTVDVAVDDFPHADAGAAIATCKSSTAVKLDGKITGGTTTGIWSTTGAGTFSPANNQLDAAYIPTDADRAAGTVALTLTSTSQDDCTISMSNTTITFMPEPTAYAGPGSDVCSQETAIQLNGQSMFADTVLWTTSGSGTFSPSANVNAPVYMPSPSDEKSGLVTLTFYSKSNFCPEVSSQLTLKFIPPPTVDMGKLQYIFRGDKVVLRPGISTPDLSEKNLHYLWSPNLYLSSDTVKNPTVLGVDDVTYTLKVTDSRGCVTEGQQSIRIIDRLNIPNTFTPNGDGINDLWDIPGLTKYPSAVIDIFTRYGSNIFHSVGYGIPWDGNYNGQRLPTGVYYYTIKTNINNQVVAGPVTIIR